MVTVMRYIAAVLVVVLAAFIGCDQAEKASNYVDSGIEWYEKGEFDLFEVLILQATALEAKRQLTRLIIDEKRQAALYNQAVGMLP